MKKRSAAKSASRPLVSPLPTSSPPQRPSSRKSPSNSYDFKVGLHSSSRRKNNRRPTTPSPLLHHQRLSAGSPTLKTLTSISDLKELASSRTGSIKRHLDLCHSEILKEIDASKSRLSKRLKLQSQACLQLTEEAEKEYKRLSDWISENTEAMKASYTKFIKEAQATAFRVCKGSIPELSQSLEKAIEGLRYRYGVPSTTT